MITLQRSNPTVTQILAAHGCQTTASPLQPRIRTVLCTASRTRTRTLYPVLCLPSRLTVDLMTQLLVASVL
jgi:hypothetical protein